MFFCSFLYVSFLEKNERNELTFFEKKVSKKTLDKILIQIKNKKLLRFLTKKALPISKWKNYS